MTSEHEALGLALLFQLGKLSGPKKLRILLDGRLRVASSHSVR